MFRGVAGIFQPTPNETEPFIMWLTCQRRVYGLVLCQAHLSHVTEPCLQ